MGCISIPKFRVIHRSLLFDAVRDPKLLREILEALTAKKAKKSSQDAPKETEAEAGCEKTERGQEDTSKVKLKKDSEAISKIVSSLARLEQSHMEQNKILIAENQELKNEDVIKISRMEDKIRSLKEALGEDEREEVNLLDRPNPTGNTLLHVSSELNDGETKRLLLEHGANPNLLDAEGNSPLHNVCKNKDIQTAICILKKDGSMLTNEKFQTPSIEELFFGQEEEDVKILMETIDQSKHREDMLNKILKKEHMLFRLVEEDKTEILSIVLAKLTDSDQEEYVNIVRDGDTVIHLATLKHKSLKNASLLLEAGARLITNTDGLTPPIEDFFSEENENQITSALVDGLVAKVNAKQLAQDRALKLLMPDDKGRKSLFQYAKKSNWGPIAEWAKGEKIDFSKMIPQLSDLELEKMVAVAKEGHWEKKEVHTLLCEEDNKGAVMLSRLQVESQLEVATWNSQEKTLQIAHKMSSEFLQWLIQEAEEGRWSGKELGAAFCQLDEDIQLKLATVDEELQKKLAVLNKTKTCLSVPMLGSNIQEWLYQEALEGRWDQDRVFRVLERKETEKGTVISAKVKHLGMHIVKSESDNHLNHANCSV